MGILGNIVRIYDDILKNKESQKVINSLNEKEFALFEGLLEDLPDFSLSKKLYQTSPSHQSFQSLKSSLLEKMLNLTFTISTGNNFQLKKLRIFRHFMAVRIFDLFGQRKIMVGLAKKTLNKAIKYDLQYEIIELARLLSFHFNLYENNTQLANEYDVIKKDALSKYKTELSVEREYTKVVGKYGTKLFNSEAHDLQKVGDYIESRLPKASSRVYLYYFSVRYVQYVSDNDFENRIDICRKAIDYFQEQPYRHELAISLFFIYLINTYLEKGELAQAELIIHSFLQQTDTNSYQFYRFKELLFRIYLFQGNTEKVNSMFNYLSANLKKMENVFSKDRLLIYSIYKALLNKEKVNFRKIKYNLNRVQQDKKGLHVPLLIGQVCHTFIHNPDKLFDQFDALEQYINKYLDEEKYTRTTAFVNMLKHKLLENDFQADNLSDLKGTISNSSLEMIEYEKLLKITIEQAKEIQDKKFETMFID